MKTEQWATPATIGAFMVTGATGMLMFFHWNTGWMKTTHEWIGWVAVIAAGAHTLRHWRAIKHYFQTTAGLAIVAAILGASLLPMLSSGNQGGGAPVRQVLTAMEKAPLTALSGVAGCTPEALAERLTAAGVNVEATHHTLAQIARENERNPMEILALVFRGSEIGERAGARPHQVTVK
jgi:hypothetical protein